METPRRSRPRRFLLRRESTGALLVDRGSFNIYLLSTAAGDLVSELRWVRKTKALAFLESLGVDNVNEYAALITNLEKLGVIGDHEFPVDFVDCQPELVTGALASPLRVFLGLTNRCDLKCRHCFMRAGKSGAEMPIDVALGLCDQFSELGVVQITVTGGEPFLYRDIWTFLEYAASLRLYVTISTNGQSITERTAARLGRLGDRLRYVNISLDGPREVNDIVRGDNSYDRALRGYRRLRNEGLKASIHVTVSSGLVGREMEFASSLRREGVDRVIFSQLIPTGRATDNSSLVPDLEEQTQLIDGLVGAASQCGLRIVAPREKSGGSVASIYKLLPPLKCAAGWFTLSIGADGYVYPCTFMCDIYRKLDIDAENIHERSLIEIWRNGKLFEFTRSSDARKSLQTGVCPVFTL